MIILSGLICIIIYEVFMELLKIIVDFLFFRLKMVGCLMVYFKSSKVVMIFNWFFFLDFYGFLGGFFYNLLRYICMIMDGSGMVIKI